MDFKTKYQEIKQLVFLSRPTFIPESMFSILINYTFYYKQTNKVVNRKRPKDAAHVGTMRQMIKK
jgi:hypothetical protein